MARRARAFSCPLAITRVALCLRTWLLWVFGPPPQSGGLVWITMVMLETGADRCAPEGSGQSKSGGLAPSSGYGASCRGPPPPPPPTPAVARYIAKNVSVTRRGAGRLRSAILGDQLMKNSPAHRIALAPFRERRKEWRCHPQWRDRMALAFRKQSPTIKDALLARKSPWPAAVGPASATLATVHDLG